MNAHRIQIFDRADDDAVVRLVADHLHLVLLPAEKRLFNEHFRGGRQFKTARNDLQELVHVVGNAAASAAQRKARTDHRRETDGLLNSKCFFERMSSTRARAFKTDFGHQLLEAFAVFGFVDGFRSGADQFNAPAAEDAVVNEIHCAVERRLAAHRRQDRIRTFFFDDARHRFPSDRFDVGRIRRLRIGHDGCGVGVHENNAIPLFA